MMGSLLLLPALALAAQPPSAAPLGLTVDHGVVLRAGAPYRGVGVNYFDLLARVLKHPDDATHRAGLQRLGRAGIPFARFMACGYWPIDNDLYLQDRPEYFRRFDRVVAAAQESGVGLIPSLFWHLSTVPDLVGEPLDQLGNPQSKTLAFVRQYTTEVVTRYQDSPAIWAWELGNEYNLAADLPNAAQHRAPVWPKLKTALARSARDDFTAAQLVVVARAFAETVRRHDPHRLLLSGNALPRTSAWHNTHERSWKPDTPAQFAEILARDNPSPLDALCVHIYPHAGDKYPAGAASIDAIVAAASQAAAQAGKPLVIGEFGAGEQAALPRQQEIVDEFLRAIQRHHVPLAALWVYDYPPHEAQFNATFDNSRAALLQAIARANRLDRDPR